MQLQRQKHVNPMTIKLNLKKNQKKIVCSNVNLNNLDNQ